MKKDLEGALKNVIGGLLESAKQDNKDKHLEIVESLKELGMEHFHLFVQYPLEMCIENFHKSSEGVFIFSHYNYVENAFSKLMEQREGSTCSVDKGRHIAKGLYNHFETGEEVYFHKKENPQYWKTETLTTEQCFSFFKAIHSAYYGNHTKLFEFYRDLLSTQESSKEG